MALTATSHDWNTPYVAYDIEFIGTRVLIAGNGSTGPGNMGVAVWDRATSTGRLWLSSVSSYTTRSCLAVGSTLYVMSDDGNLHAWDFSDWDLPVCTYVGSVGTPNGFAASDGTYLCAHSRVVTLSSGMIDNVTGLPGSSLWYAAGGVGYTCNNNTTNLHIVNLSTHSISSTVTLPRTLMIERAPSRTIACFDGKLWFATNDLVPTMMTYRLSDGDIQVFSVTTPGGTIPTQNMSGGARYMGTMLLGPDDLFYAVTSPYGVAGGLRFLEGVFDPSTLTWWTESFAALPSSQYNPRFNGSKLWTITGNTVSPEWP